VQMVRVSQAGLAALAAVAAETAPEQGCSGCSGQGLQAEGPLLGGGGCQRETGTALRTLLQLRTSKLLNGNVIDLCPPLSSLSNPPPPWLPTLRCCS